MWGRRTDMAASLPSALLGAISAVFFAPILVQAQDLGSVLEKQANLTTFTSLFKVGSGHCFHERSLTLNRQIQTSLESSQAQALLYVR